MARPRIHDRDAALKAAMMLFWRQGYERTSISELEAAMGMKRASIYAAFGDKEALFLKVLAAYAEEMRAGRLQALLQAPHPRAALEAHFRAMAVPGQGGVPGCLITNSSVELAGLESEEGRPAARTQLTCGLRMIEEVFARVIARGQEMGEIASTRPPHALARHLVNTAQGLRVLSANPDMAPWLDDILATAFGPLDAG